MPPGSDRVGSPAGAASGMTSANWHVIDTGCHNGAFNMRLDLDLVERFKADGIPKLRFYCWEPYCISLGRNQAETDINLDLAAAHGIDVVKRPTGGKAVLHAEELTYSVVMAAGGMSVRESYNLISRALAEGLRSMGADVRLSQSSADFRKLFHDPSTIPCFSTSAVFEVEYRGRKLVGSAQHRFGTTLLQHGSILTGNFHKRIVNYLAVDDDLKEKTLLDLEEHTSTLGEILGEVGAVRLKESIMKGFTGVMGAEFAVGEGGTVSVRDAAEAR